ncbi:MAG: aminotransferase class IV [Deltaproteobacteria bacterium]|nr:aminotransferase class IV [Deltaproteobacteria bacterium]
MSFIYINGNYLPEKEALVSCFDRSFLFGEGLFESFKSCNSQCFFLKDHINRLEWSATYLGIDFPSSVNFAEVCQTLLDKNQFKDARFKIVLSRAGCGFTDTAHACGHTDHERAVNLIVFCEDLCHCSHSTHYKLKVIKDLRNDALPLALIKTTNNLVKTLARAHAKEAGFDDGILLNAQGLVTETCTANIFWVDKDARLWTILKEQGALPGIMQKNLLEVLKENKISIKEGLISPQDLSNAREIFITNSIIGIKPVITVDGRQISGGETGSITAMLTDVWQKHLDKLLNPHKAENTTRAGTS